jgi:tetratricopeptide (TPR) repeat protein
MGWEDGVAAATIAERAAQAAILADSGDPWAHYALACVYMYARRFDDSSAEFEWALRLNPNFSLALCYYGLLFFYCGRADEAELATARALRLNPRDPLSAVYFGAAAGAQYIKHNYKEAVRLAREAVRQRPDFPASYRILTAAAGMAGEAEIAKTSLQELRRVQPDLSLEWIKKRVPFRDETGRQHYMEGLRRAGLH